VSTLPFDSRPLDSRPLDSRPLDSRPLDSLPFDSLYRHGFARVAAAVPSVRVADPAFNVKATLELARRADAQGVSVVVFPELGITAYSCEDLFHQQALLNEVNNALGELVRESVGLHPMLVVGAPIRVGSSLFNTAVVIHRGKVLGVVPKSYLPGYREFYEERQFAAERDRLEDEVVVAGQRCRFGARQLFRTGIDGLVVHVEICEDIWVPVPPSTWAALAGATVLLNLSGSPITVGKAAYRRELCRSHSARCISAYVYTGAGEGESTTDLAWDGHAMVTENGALLAESTRFAGDPQLVVADVDLGRLLTERSRQTSFADAIADDRQRIKDFHVVDVDLVAPSGPLSLVRDIERFPFVPTSPVERDERCDEVFNIQVQGLAQRLRSTGINKVVIGVSGGLDSTQALLVCVRTFDRLGLDRKNILAYTMPGFATSQRTLDQANALMAALGVAAHTIDIRPACEVMLHDLDHPYANGQPVYDVTFENVQAGQRTSHLFRLANHHGGLVVGTGDLSELALGWCTYGVGDQMSHYNVNSSVPKTLIQHLIRWEAGRWEASHDNDDTAAVLQAIVNTEISPELVPTTGKEHGKEHSAGTQPSQRTQDVIGPYELQDFVLYYTTRFGFAPSKIAFMAHHSWGELDRGTWSDLVPAELRHAYDLPTIKQWMTVFMKRFFGQSQFKRSAMPNGPKVGSGGSLSPRGDWRAPSDGSAAPWLAELQRNVPV
jgi:NAD+ synthase (glutamine-hydrolysing)